MMTIYKSVDNKLVVTDEISGGAWINLVAPTDSELKFIAKKFSIDEDMVFAAMDTEERARIEYDDETGTILVLVDIPMKNAGENSRLYDTYPLGIIYTSESIITICTKASRVFTPFEGNNVKTFFTYKKSRFILQILYRIAQLYLYDLKDIDKQSSIIENELHKSMKNKELIQLLDLEKSLVYFSTSLKSNELVMERLMRFDFIKKYEEDTELLEDTIIENKQAIEMAKIYSDILSGTMDAFASVISNNLNIVMKFLTSVTIILSIPTIISSFFGMNVTVPLQDNPLAFASIFVGSILICSFIAFWMNKKKMF